MVSSLFERLYKLLYYGTVIKYIHWYIKKVYMYAMVQFDIKTKEGILEQC